MRVMKWVTVAGLLVGSLLLARYLIGRAVNVSWGYAVEARFDTMPPNETGTSQSGWEASPGSFPIRLRSGDSSRMESCSLSASSRFATWPGSLLPQT